MKRPRILLVTIHACRMPGAGGDVRAHFLTKTATSIGEVTLVSFAGSLQHSVDPNIRSICSKVLSHDEENTATKNSTTARQGSGLRLLTQPWRLNWTPFVAACVQHVWRTSGSLRQRLLSTLLRFELAIFHRLGMLPPAKCLAWFNNYQQIKPAVLAEEAHGGKFDVLWVEDVFSWPFAEDLLASLGTPPQKVICNTYNIETQLAHREARACTSAAAARIAWWNANQLLRMERAAYSRSTLTLVCSKPDMTSGHQLVSNARFQVLENGVDLSYFQPRQRINTQSEPVLLLTGTFNYGPNLDAARHFAVEILPKIRKHIPGVRFKVAGRNARSVAEHLGPDGIRVEVVSDPEDIRPCFEEASVFVVPLLVGGGTRLKILEAMAMGVPVVSTSIGAEGLDAENGVQLLVGDSPEEFANCCLRILQGQQGEELVANASAWVSSRYGWSALCEKAKSLVEVALAE